MVISLRPGQTRDFDELLRKLIEIRYERNDIAFERNMFRVRGDTVEIFPAYANDKAIRVEFFGDEIDRISEINIVTGMPLRYLNHVAIYPASHYVTPRPALSQAIKTIKAELKEQNKSAEIKAQKEYEEAVELGDKMKEMNIEMKEIIKIWS